MEYLEVTTIVGKNKDGSLIERKTTEVVYNVDDFPYRKYTYHKIVGKKDIVYYNISASFDIETTSIEPPKNEKDEYLYQPYGFMYQWQFCLIDTVVFGRTWEQFQYFIQMLTEGLRLNSKTRLVVFSHNLAFEFQFMKDFLSIESMFAKDKRKPLKITTPGIEWRCSYFLSNMSLAKFCENSKGCVYWKKKDTYNYRIIRTPDTPLSQTEKEYCYCDVRGLNQCIDSLLVDDDITTMPLTSTGYVRRDCRNEMNTSKWRRIFKKCEINLRQYKLLREAFRGGDTHANRKYAGKIIEDVKSKDIESSYPAVCMQDYFPMGKLTKVNIKTQEELDKYCSKYCVIMRVNIFKPKVKEDEPFPYIPIAKCIKHSKIVNDNGRVLQAHYVQMSMTEIDLEIIREQYTYEGISIDECYISERGQLPEELQNVIIDYYTDKTSLKGLSEFYYEYMKKKNKLNAIYGMMVSALVHNIITYKDHEWIVENEDSVSALKKYAEGRNNFLLYQHGIYVTAHARRRLRKGVKLVKDGAIYQDTDAVKFFYYQMDVFEELNEEIRYTAIHNIVPSIAKDPKGETHYMGIWDDDGKYKRFKTLGAKKYAYEDEDGFHITVSGMAKEKGAKAIKKLENFEIGQKPFENVGRTTSWYNEADPHEITITDCNGIESTFTTASNIAVLDSTYKLGITLEYAEILEKYIDVESLY